MIAVSLECAPPLLLLRQPPLSSAVHRPDANMSAVCHRAYSMGPTGGGDERTVRPVYNRVPLDRAAPRYVTAS